MSVKAIRIKARENFFLSKQVSNNNYTALCMSVPVLEKRFEEYFSKLNILCNFNFYAPIDCN